MDEFKSIKETSEFERKKRKFAKKYISICEDIQNFVDIQLILFHKHDFDNHGIFPLKGLTFRYPKVYKSKKFACRSLKGKGARSGFRVIHAYFYKEDQILLVDLYHKSDQSNEDKNLIEKSISNNTY